MSSVIGRIAIILAALVSAGTADAADPAGWEVCAGSAFDKYPAPQRLVACTALIEGGQIAQINLRHIYARRGRAYLSQKQYDQAISDFNRAIELSLDNAEMHYHRGVAYGEKGELDKSLVDFERAIALDPNYLLGYEGRAISRARQGKCDQAAVDAQFSFHRNPKSDARDLVKRFCDARQRQMCNPGGGEFSLAQRIAACSFLIEMGGEPQYILAQSYNNRATHYNGTGQYDLAIIDLGAAIRLKPDFAEAHLNRGISYYYKGQRDQALAELSHAIEIRPEFPEAYSSRAVVYSETGRCEQAAADAEQAIRFNPGSKVREVLAKHCPLFH